MKSITLLALLLALVTLACGMQVPQAGGIIVPVPSPVMATVTIPSPVMRTPDGARVVIFATDTYIRSCADLDCPVIRMVEAGARLFAVCRGGWCSSDNGFFCLAAARGEGGCK